MRGELGAGGAARLVSGLVNGTDLMDQNDMTHLFPVFLAVLSMSITTPAVADDKPTTKTFAYKTIPGGKLELVVHYPPGWKETDKRPAIVFFFGGGWMGGTIRQFEPQADHLASRGMVAARADYRVKSRQGVTPTSASRTPRVPSAGCGQRRHAGHRPRPDRRLRGLGRRARRRLHGPHRRSGSRGEDHDLVEAERPGALQPGAAVRWHVAPDGPHRQR